MLYLGVWGQFSFQLGGIALWGGLLPAACLCSQLLDTWAERGSPSCKPSPLCQHQTGVSAPATPCFCLLGALLPSWISPGLLSL